VLSHDKRIKRLLLRIHSLVGMLKRERNSLVVHRAVDQFYYMQKAEQLMLLQEQLREAQERLRIIENRIDEEYRGIFYSWVKDVRWLHRNIIRQAQVDHAKQ
jgi:hypothetical protein